MSETEKDGHPSAREHDDHVLWIAIGFCLVVPVILISGMMLLFKLLPVSWAMLSSKTYKVFFCKGY